MATLPKSLEGVVKTPLGKDLSRFIAETILELNTLDGIDFSNREKAVIEGMGRKLASEKLTSILSTLLTNQDSRIIKSDKDDLSMTLKGSK